MENPSLSPLNEYDLDVEEVQELEAEGVLLGDKTRAPRIGTKRKVQMAALSSSYRSSVTSTSSSGSSSASLRIHGFGRPKTGTIDLPVFEESPDMLEFIGFTQETSNAIYSNFLARPDPTNDPYDLLQYSFDFVRSKDPQEQHEDREILARMGINNKIQEALLDEDFAEIRATATLRFWLLDTLQVNYDMMCSFRRNLKLKARISKAKKRRRIQHSGNIFQKDQEMSSSATEQSSTQTGAINIPPKENGIIDLQHVAIGSEIPLLQDHQVLYSGKCFSYLADFILPDGSVSLRSIASFSGGDFNDGSPATYWSPDLETAEKYRKWAQRRNPIAESCIIQIQISQRFLREIKTEVLSFSPDWKEYVWRCRHKGRRGMLPKFQKFRNADLIKGHICKMTLSAINNIRDPEDVQQRITEDSVLLREDGRRATQWAFLASVEERLNVEIRGKIQIDITQSEEPE